MDNETATDAERDALLRVHAARLMALEVMVRALLMTHPNQAALHAAVCRCESGLDHALPANLATFARDLIQSCLDQAGLG